MLWFPLLLVLHVVLAVSLLLPSLVLPFLLRSGGSAAGHPPSSFAKLLMRIQGTGSLVIGAGLAITGAGLLAALGPDLIRKPWLLAALSIYAINLLVAGFVSRPNLRRLLRIGGSDGTSDEAWRRGARRQRWLAYAMALATGVIGFLMSAKPEF